MGILIGRGKKCYEHTGNKNLLTIVSYKLDEYATAKSKIQKSQILASVVSEIQWKCPVGGFIKKDSKTGLYFRVGELLAREKVSQAFRDALHDRYKSSNASRKKARTSKAKKAKAERMGNARKEVELYSLQQNKPLHKLCGVWTKGNTTPLEIGSSSIELGFSNTSVTSEEMWL